MSDEHPAKPSLTRRFFGFVMKLVLMLAIFGMGYYTGAGNFAQDPVDSLKGHVKDMTSTLVEKSSELKHDLTLRHALNKAKATLLEAKEEIQHKNFGRAQDEVDEAIILLNKARTMPDIHGQIETQIDNLRTRLLDVQNDLANLKPAVKQKIDDITQDIEQLRHTAPAL